MTKELSDYHKGETGIPSSRFPLCVGANPRSGWVGSEKLQNSRSYRSAVLFRNVDFENNEKVFLVVLKSSLRRG